MQQSGGFDEGFESLLARLEREDIADDESLGDEVEYLRHYQNRFRRIYEQIPNRDDPLSVLDIGTTPFTYFVNNQFPEYSVETLDYTEKMAARSERNGVEFTKHDLNTQTLPYDDETFDCIIFTEVLETFG